MNLFSIKGKLIALGILFILLVFFLNLGKSSNINSLDRKTNITPTHASAENESVTYHGILPCDSCDGYDTTITLIKTKSGDNGTYKLSEKKLGLDNVAITYDGIWTTSYGLDDEHPDAKIIVLDPDDEDILTGYYVVDDAHIEELDYNGYRYDDPEKYQLTLQK